METQVQDDVMENLSEHERTRIILMANAGRFSMLIEEIQNLRFKAFVAGMKFAKDESERP